jgi:hypothetical protein
MPITEADAGVYLKRVRTELAELVKASPINELVTTLPRGIDDFDVELTRTAPTFTPDINPDNGVTMQKRTLGVTRQVMEDVRVSAQLTVAQMSDLTDTSRTTRALRRAVEGQVADAVVVLMAGSTPSGSLNLAWVDSYSAALNTRGTRVLVQLRPVDDAVVKGLNAFGVAVVDVRNWYEQPAPQTGQALVAAVLVESTGPALNRYVSRALEVTVVVVQPGGDAVYVSIDERRALSPGQINNRLSFS